MTRDFPGVTVSRTSNAGTIHGKRQFVEQVVGNGHNKRNGTDTGTAPLRPYSIVPSNHLNLKTVPLQK